MLKKTTPKTKDNVKHKAHNKETYSQTLMNYEIIRDKMQTEFKPKDKPYTIPTTKPRRKNNF